MKKEWRIHMENLLNMLTELSKSLRANHTYKKSTTDCFNIFNVLGVQSREVIICRFIGELIKPDGAHNMGIVPLKLFFKEVLKQDISDADAQNAEIVLEDKIDDKRRVDIAIFVGNKVYPIEAKVWAIDQKSQLFDYYSYYKKENKDIDKIYYLTPSGKAPSKDSIKSLITDNIRCISFENEVLSWITNIKIDVDCNLKSALKQFEEVIIDMTAEFKKYSAITNILNIDDAEHYSSNELLKAAVILMNNKDDIIKTVTLNYIKTKIYVGTDNKYIKVELNNDTKSKSDLSHAVLRIVDDSTKKTVAWICLEANLYIATKNKTKKGSCKNYIGQYYWQYINPDGRNSAFPLKKLECIFDDDRNIDIQKYLDDLIID